MPTIGKKLESYLAKKRAMEKINKEPRKKSFLSRIFGFGSKVENDYEILEESKTQANDLRELAKISLNLIKQLPEEKLIVFRNSEDFAKLKEILKRNELTK